MQSSDALRGVCYREVAMAEFKTIYIEEGNALREVQTDYDFEEYRRRKKEDEERRLREKRKAKLKRASVKRVSK